MSSTDVVEAVSSHSGGILAASGVALGLVDGEELVIVAADLAPDAPDVSRLTLTDETLMTEAARTGSVAVAEDRASLLRSYPDSAARSARRASSVRWRSRFARRAPSSDRSGSSSSGRRRSTATRSHSRASSPTSRDRRSSARACTSPSGRSGARSTGSSVVAPRFLREDADDVVGVICREARSTFGADYGVLWRVRDEGLDLLAIDPPRPDLVETRLRLDDFPRLREAIEGLGSSFVPDVLETTYGEGFDFVRELGIRSSLRTPVVIAGSSELVLAISWQVVVSEPDQATIAVVRSSPTRRAWRSSRSSGAVPRPTPSDARTRRAGSRR